MKNALATALLASAVFLSATAFPANATSAGKKISVQGMSLSDMLMTKVVAGLSDNGLTMEMTVHCAPESLGIIHFDKVERRYLCSKNQNHTVFALAWKSTCGFGTVAS